MSDEMDVNDDEMLDAECGEETQKNVIAHDSVDLKEALDAEDVGEGVKDVKWGDSEVAGEIILAGGFIVYPEPFVYLGCPMCGLMDNNGFSGSRWGTTMCCYADEIDGISLERWVVKLLVSQSHTHTHTQSVDEVYSRLIEVRKPVDWGYLDTPNHMPTLRSYVERIDALLSDARTAADYQEYLIFADHIPHTDESDAAHEQAADAAAKGVEEKVHLCDCPLCDSNSESGCMNEGTILIPQSESCGSDYWFCPACAGSVAATRGLRVGEEPLSASEKGEACAACNRPLAMGEGIGQGGYGNNYHLCLACDKASRAKARTEYLAYEKSGGDEGRARRHDAEGRQCLACGGVDIDAMGKCKRCGRVLGTAPELTPKPKGKQ
jgi:hypothetical protein